MREARRQRGSRGWSPLDEATQSDVPQGRYPNGVQSSRPNRHQDASSPSSHLQDSRAVLITCAHWRMFNAGAATRARDWRWKTTAVFCIFDKIWSVVIHPFVKVIQFAIVISLLIWKRIALAKMRTSRDRVPPASREKKGSNGSRFDCFCTKHATTPKEQTKE